jgi:hypothetical protein
LSQVKQVLISSSTSLSLTVDIPFWFDDIETITYKSVTKPLNQHVQDIADRIVIMDYRDFAEGNDGIIFHAQDEITYANIISKDIVIGIETKDIEPEKLTFFEEGEVVVESQFALVEQVFQANSAFDGFAIHDYSGYSALTTQTQACIYLPIIQKNQSAN